MKVFFETIGKEVELPNNQVLNSHFLVKVSGLGYHQLVGWPMLVELIGEELAEKALSKAFFVGMDKCTFKLRRGLKLDFYSK